MTDIAPILDGDVRAGARLMRDLDDRRPDAIAALKALFPHTGKAYIVGITGNPGAGKSTVVDALIAHYRAAGREGRRGRASIRRRRSPAARSSAIASACSATRSIPDVFIRSLATRGHLGGLSRSTFDVAHVLDAMGYTRILIETVGVGQDEVEVMKAAHTTVVVTVPGLGDDIQAIKAGLLEVADVLVVNKADREGADRTERDLMHMLDLRTRRPQGRRDREDDRDTWHGRGLRASPSWPRRSRPTASASWQGPAGGERAQSRARVAQLAELVRALLADRAARAMAARGGLARDRAGRRRRNAAIRGRSPKSSWRRCRSRRSRASRPLAGFWGPMRGWTRC